MGAKTTILVYLPGKEPAVGAVIIGVNRNAWNRGVATSRGTTGEDGSHVWSEIDTGTAGDFYDFEAKFIDENGVRWIGKISERIKRNVNLTITLTPEYSTIQISKEAIENLQKEEKGKSILEGIKELQTALSSGLIHACITTSTWIIEGLIIIKAKKLGIWNDSFEGKTFGELVNIKEIREMFPVNMRDRIQGAVNWRKPHAHFKGSITIREEAQLISYLVKDLAEEWFGRK